jgi:hypothetical protein
MKTSQRQTPSRPPKSRRKPDSLEALRACEAAAVRIKAASDELAACWAALGRDLAAGLSPTDLLKKRAWCNVLELRLKEQAHALEAARLAIDAVWDEIMLGVRARQSFKRALPTNPERALPVADELPLLLRAAEAIAATRSRAVPLKK